MLYSGSSRHTKIVIYLAFAGIEREEFGRKMKWQKMVSAGEPAHRRDATNVERETYREEPKRRG
jgi:hypothetical protein